MADADVDEGVDNTALSADEQALQKEALDMGWNPDHKGPNFITAKDFVDRGKSILPIVNATNARLKAELAAANARAEANDARVRAVEAGQAALEDAREADLAAARKEERAAVREELARASEAGDHRAVATATDDLTRLNAEEVEAKRLAEERAAAGNTNDTLSGGDTRPRLDSVTKAWLKEHQEFARSPERIALGNVVGAKLLKEGTDLKGTAFLDEVEKRVEKMLGGNGRQSRVEGGGATGGRQGGGSAGGKGYADLPPDAKATCDRQAARFVGAGRAHKDEKSWQKAYASKYFGQG